MSRSPDTSAVVLHVPGTVAEAVDLLVDESVEVLAGGTWVMRGEVRRDGFAKAYVLVTKIPDLMRLEHVEGALIVGAGVTHDRLGSFLSGDRRFNGLATAARGSANPAIRRIATIGGNISAAHFPAADLVPALLALKADVKVVDAAGQRCLPLQDHLLHRDPASSGSLITEVVIPVPPGYSAHERLTMRVAGDYPAAIVSAHVELSADGIVEATAIAVGSVEPVGRLWDSLASQLVGSRLDAARAEEVAKDLTHEFEARDGVESAGWYRLQVLPVLVRRVIHAIEQERRGHED